MRIQLRIQLRVQVGSPRSTDQHEIVRNETSNAPDASGSAQPYRANVAEFDKASPRIRGNQTGIPT